MPCNDLIFKEVHPVPPPINLDVTDEKKPSQSDEKLSSYALRLIRRLLNLADADFTSVPFNDRDLLEEALSGTKLNVIARRQKCSGVTIRRRVINALDIIALKMSSWENQQRQLNEMGEEIKKLQADALNRREQIAELSQTVTALETENGHLRSIVKAYSEKRPKLPSGLTKVDESTRTLLCSDLKSVGIPPTVAIRFASHNIHTVSDIIRYTDRQLAELDGVSADDISIVKLTLERYDLELGTSIRLISIENDYYIYPNKQ